MNKKLLPLAILETSNDDSIEGITRFQKLVFLAQREELGEEIYKFIPGSYGPFSKSLYDDIDKLVEEGFVEEKKEPSILSSSDDKQIYRLKKKGHRALEAGIDSEEAPATTEELEELVSDYNTMGLWDLLEYVYTEYPKMAKNSNLHI